MKLFRSFAIMNFMVWMAIFLLYRNGSLDSILFQPSSIYFPSLNGGSEVRNTGDSLKVDTIPLHQQRRVSASPPVPIDKVMPGVEKMEPIPDSAAIKREEAQMRMSKMMSSSKTGPVIVRSQIISPPIRQTKGTVTKEKKNKKRE